MTWVGELPYFNTIVWTFFLKGKYKLSYHSGAVVVKESKRERVGFEACASAVSGLESRGVYGEFRAV